MLSKLIRIFKKFSIISSRKKLSNKFKVVILVSTLSASDNKLISSDFLPSKFDYKFKFVIVEFTFNNSHKSKTVE